MVWRVARSLDALLGQINAAAPNRSKIADGSIGDAEHASRASDHNPDSRGIVHARDYTHDPGDGCNVDTIFASIIASGDSRVSYLIRNRRITQWSDGRLVWVAYSGSNPHTLHGHVSVTRAGEDDTRPWSIGGTNTTQEDDVLTEADKRWFGEWRARNEASFGDIWRVLGVRKDGSDRLSDLWAQEATTQARLGDLWKVLGIRADGGDRIRDLWDQERATQAQIAGLVEAVKALQDRP